MAAAAVDPCPDQFARLGPNVSSAAQGPAQGWLWTLSHGGMVGHAARMGWRRRPTGGRSGSEHVFRANAFVWELFAGAALAVGFVAGAPALGVLGVFDVFVVAGTLFWGFAFMVGGLVKVRMTRVLAASVLCGASIVAAAGWVVLIGAWGLALPVAVAVSRPGLLSRLRDHRSEAFWRAIRYGIPLPSGTAEDVAVMAAVGGPVDAVTSIPPPGLDDTSLLRAWEDSWVALRKAATGPDALRVVEFRSECLDELERRNPAGIREWLAAGASDSREPARYLPPQLGVRRAEPDGD
jgi:hypothetical protein